MHVHPAIAALRSDPASQHRTQRAMTSADERWRRNCRIAAIERDLEVYDQGRALEDLPALHAAITDHSEASATVSLIFEAMTDALRGEPLGEVPMRHSSSAGFARLQLLQTGGSALSLCVYEPVPDGKEAVTARFTDCAIVEMIVAGRVSGTYHTLQAHDGSTYVASENRLWAAGDTIIWRACRDTRHFINVASSVLVLQLSRSPKTPRPSAEHRIIDGAMVRQSSGDKRASEKLMALAVLGALDHRDGVKAMAEFARDKGQDPDARWEAVRQILPMDSHQGMALLAQLAARDADVLAKPAADLSQHLISIQPELAVLQTEDAQCRK